MKKGIIIFGIFTAFMLIAALPGQAQQYWQQEMWPNEGMNLTSEQIAKIQKLTLEFQKDILPMETQLQTLYMEVGPLPYGDTEQAKYNSAFKKIDALEMELEKKYMAHENQIRALLTEEQKALFDQWGGLGYELERMGLGMNPGMGFSRGYAGYGRGYEGYGRGYAGYGRGNAGYGRGNAGYGRGYSGYGRGYSGYGRGYSGYGRGYAGYGRGYAGYGRGNAGYGRGYAGYGRGYAGYGRGYGTYGKGYSGYGRGYAGYGRGFGQGWNQGMGRGWGRGPGMGRGYWCPWYQQGMFNRLRNW